MVLTAVKTSYLIQQVLLLLILTKDHRKTCLWEFYVLHCASERKWDRTDEICFCLPVSYTIVTLFILCFWTLSIVLSLSKNHPVYFSRHNVLETGFCLCLQVKPTQLGPIDRASPHLWTSVPASRWGIQTKHHTKLLRELRKHVRCLVCILHLGAGTDVRR
jgi:hypothetical protein